MPKFEVQIFGTVPDCIEVEAANQDAACEKAITEVLDLLTFEAGEADEKTGCAEAKSDGIRKH